MAGAEYRRLLRDARKAFREAKHHQFLAEAFLAYGRELERKARKAVRKVQT